MPALQAADAILRRTNMGCGRPFVKERSSRDRRYSVWLSSRLGAIKNFKMEQQLSCGMIEASGMLDTFATDSVALGIVFMPA
jgi:hypothetical protein